MRYITFHTDDLSISVDSKRGPIKTSFRAEPRNKQHLSLPLSDIVYHEVLYPAVYAADKRLGLRIAYKLKPPDPWLVALAMVMWQGIVQGLTWDVIKILVKKVLQVLSDEGLAPSKTTGDSVKKSRTELGFVWIEYKNGRKQYQMFLGLRRVYNKNKRKKRK